MKNCLGYLERLVELTEQQKKMLENSSLEDLNKAFEWAQEVIDGWESLEDLVGEGIWKDIIPDFEFYKSMKEQMERFKLMTNKLNNEITKRNLK